MRAGPDYEVADGLVGLDEIAGPDPMPRPDAARWHLARSRRMLETHPEIGRLIGVDPRTALPIIALVALQLAIAFALRGVPLWTAFLIAWSLGTIVAHALGVAIHELAHDLVFARRWKNKALAIIANLPLGFPGAIDFRDKHLRHHRYLGDRKEDTQAPSEIEARLTGTSSARKIAWLTFGPLIFHGAKSHGRRRASHYGWITLNAVLCFAMWPLAAWVGHSTFVYLFVSALFAFGPHPVGIRRFAEHVPLAPDQPTSSYYGFWNRFAFNVGHHVEHHDHPGIPWTRIARLKEMAPEFYRPLRSVDSWSRLLVSLFFDRRCGVDRYVREGFLREKNGLPKVGPPC